MVLDHKPHVLCYIAVVQKFSYFTSVNSGLTSHQQRGHTETGPRFKVSSERLEKRGIDLATPGFLFHLKKDEPTKIKSIFQGCMVWIEKSVTRVTDRHHEACLVMPNSDP